MLEILRTPDLPAPERLATARLAGVAERIGLKGGNAVKEFAAILAGLDREARARVVAHTAAPFLERPDRRAALGLLLAYGCDVDYAYRIAITRAHEPDWSPPLEPVRRRLLAVEQGAARAPLPARGRRISWTVRSQTDGDEQAHVHKHGDH